MRLIIRILLATAVVVLTAAIGLFVTYRIGLYIAEPLNDEPFALVNARLIDGVSDEPLDEAVVVVENNQIRAVGTAEDVDIPSDATIHELDGRTVIPGMFDAHVHLGAPELQEDERLQDIGTVSLIWRALRQAPDARRGFIEHGVTSVKNTGDPDDWIIGVRDSIRDGHLEGPRIFTSGPLITAPGGHPAGTMFAGNDFVIETATRQIADGDEAREAIVELDELGVDFIKIVLDRGGDGQLPTLDAERIEAVVDEARTRDLKVFSHWRYEDEFDMALRAGIDGLEHPGYDRLSDAQVDRLVEDDVAYTPTLAVFTDGDELPEAGSANVRAITEAGGRLVAGSDVPNVGLRFGPALHRELELLVDAGVSPMQALRAATSDAAAHLGQQERLGTIEPDKLADIVVLGADPLEDISAVRDVEMVIRDGKILVDHLDYSNRGS